MSCWMVSDESLCMISSLIVSVGIGGYNGYGFELPEELDDLFRETSRETNGAYDAQVRLIAERLHSMNADAVSYRYPDDREMVTEFEYVDAHIHRPTRELEQWHFDILARIRCYLYQCNEGNVPEYKLYKGIEALGDIIAWHILHKLPEMEKAMENNWR